MKNKFATQHRYISAVLIFVMTLIPVAPVFAVYSSSTNYQIFDASFGGGQEMSSDSFTVTGELAQPSIGSFISENLPLVAGTITSCGKIAAAGTYTLGTNLYGISGTCFTVLSDNVVIDGAGYIVTASDGNASYAVMATSTVAGGAGYNNLTIQNIIFSGFVGGVNASGNGGATAGVGGSVIISNSSLGNITVDGGSANYGAAGGSAVITDSVFDSVTARGGDSDTGNGAAGGSISITGTSLNLVGKTISVAGGDGNILGTQGFITVSGSLEVSSGQTWSGNDGSWQGTRTWSFTDNAYNTGWVTGETSFEDATYNGGTVNGDVQFKNLTATNNTITIDAVSSPGTGAVTGLITDSLGETISAWEFINGATLIGTVTGDAVFSDTSYSDTGSTIYGDATFNDSAYNKGTITGNAVFNDGAYNAGTLTNATFTASSFNSGTGIPNGDPTGISSGKTVSGTIIFSSASPVTFNVNTGSVWSANTTAWIFATSSPSWIFSSAHNTGVLMGDATFNTGYNAGVVSGDSTFNTSSYNSGTTTNAFFYSNSYNIGRAQYASFYNTSKNSYNSSAGRVTVQCDFYESSLPGIGICPVGATYYHIPYYFNNAVSSNWNDSGNWWFNAGFTEPASGLPQTGDSVYIGASVTQGPTTHVTLGTIYVASSTTGGGSFAVDLTNASGPAYFYDQSTNEGEVDGVFHVFGNRGFSSVNNGTYTSDVAFYNNSYNNTTIPSNAYFYDTSYNASNGIVSGNAEFFGNNRNDGTIVGVATINSGATLSGNGTVQNSVLNSGNVEGGIFNGLVTNFAGAITGTITNVVKMVFRGGSYVASGGSISGDADFNATSSNRGTIFGTSFFYDLAYNIGTTTDATFVGDTSENDNNGIIGIITGVSTRLYTALAPQTNFIRNFVDRPWTIIADNTVVKLLYRDLVDLFGESSNTTTLVERNGGFILRPLSPSAPITSCGVLDVENGTYTLGANISNYQFDTCFIVRANGVTLNGNNHIVTASNNTDSLYAITATSTLGVDGTANAFTDLTVKNIKFNNFAHGLYGRGADVPNGVGGNGSTVTFINTTIGDIDVSGGDPIDRGGDGGDVTIETSVTTHIVSRGGDSVACGLGGNGGNIYITTDSTYISYVNEGGQVYGCEGEDPTPGTQGAINTQVVSTATRQAQVRAQEALIARRQPIQDVMKLGTQGLFSGLPTVFKLSPISFKSILSFSANTSGNSFSFIEKINKFMYGTLPISLQNMYASTPTLLKVLGINYAQDVVNLMSKSKPAPLTSNVPGLYSFTYSSSPAWVPSLIAYSAQKVITQIVRVEPKETLVVHVIPTIGGVHKVYFNNKEYVIDNNKVVLSVPATPGKYEFVTSASPLPLVIDVQDTQGITKLLQIEKASIFREIGKTIWKFFTKISPI